MAEEVDLLARLLDAGAMLVEGGPLLAQALGGVASGPGAGLQPAEGVEDGAMGFGVDEGSVVVLAVDLDQTCPDRLQNLHADGLVVDERTGAAVRKLQAPQDEVSVRGQVGVGGNPSGGVAGRCVEDGRHLPLRFPVPDEAAIAAPAERQGEGIKQDRFPGAGLAREDAQPGREVQLEPIDQDNVADRELCQHPAEVYRFSPTVRVRPRKLRLIHDPASSRGSRPPDRRSACASLYQGLSGKL